MVKTYKFPKEINVNNALLLVASVKTALINGIKHYSQHEKLLTSEEEIVACIAENLEILIDGTKMVEKTTFEEQQKLVHEGYKEATGNIRKLVNITLGMNLTEKVTVETENDKYIFLP